MIVGSAVIGIGTARWVRAPGVDEYV